MTEALVLLLLATPVNADAPKAASPQKAVDWLAPASKTLTSSDTAQWEATLEVKEAPPVAAQARKYAFHLGTTRYQFRVKGDGRLYWAEKWEGKGDVPTRQAWYEGNILYLRSTKEPKKLLPVEVGEGEGYCVKRSLVEGGILGWRLAHHFDDEVMGGGYVAAMDVQWVGEKKIKDVLAVVIDVKIGFGFGPERARREAGTTRLWINKKTFLPMKRETTMNLGTEDKPARLRVEETYSNWKLNEPLANDIFHVEGMGPPFALVDAPKDAAAFEGAQTRKFLGFAVRPFPHPQGPTKFDELPADAPAFAFTLTPHKVSGPEPRVSYHPRTSVVAKAPDGGEIEALCGYDDPKVVVSGHKFTSTPANRRHQYGGGAYHPYDVFIGKRVDGRIKAGLFFRDVGSHNTAPHHLAVDSKGRCHLMVADVDIGQSNRFKLYWLIGDLAAGKWTQAWLVDHRNRFTSWAHPWSAAWKEQVHMIWNWADLTFGDKARETGVYHVDWTPAGFGRKIRVFKGRAESLDMAVDPNSGRLVLVFSTEEGVFVASKPAQGPWTRATRLHPELVKEHTVSVQAAEKGALVIRTHRGKTREWLLTIGERPKNKAPKSPTIRKDRLGDPLPEGAVTRMGSVRLVHEAFTTCIAFSPDGQILASGSDDGEIALWEIPTGKEIRKFQAHSWTVTALAFSPDGKQLVSSARDRTVRVWDVHSGREIHRLKHEKEVNSVAYSAKGKLLASASSDTIRLWDAASGKPVRQLTVKKETFMTLAFDPQSNRLAFASWKQTALYLWDLDKSDKPRRLKGHEGGAFSLAFSQDGKILASAGWDGKVILSDPARGVEIRHFGEGLLGPAKERRLSVTAMAISADGKIIASGNPDDAILLWDAGSGKPFRRLGPSERELPGALGVRALAFSPDGKYLASTNMRKISLWEVTTGKEIRPGDGHGNWLNSVAFSPDGKLLATASDDRTVILWKAATGAPVRRLKHGGEVTRVAFSPDGKTLASSSRDKTVYLWDVIAEQPVKRLQGHADAVMCLAFSRDGKMLATGSGDRTIRLWEMPTGKELRQLKGHESWIGSLVFSTDGKALFSGSADGTVRVWDVAAGKQLRQFGDSQTIINSIALSPDGMILATGFFQQKTIRLWDLGTGKERSSIVGPTGGSASIAFSRDGKILAAAGDEEIRFVDLATGKEMDRLYGHLERVFCIAFSRDGTKLASASGDFTALVWDVSRKP